MQRIQPKVLIHRNPTARIEIIHRRRPVLIPDAVIRRIQQPGGFRVLLRVVEDGVEERVAVEQERRRVGVSGSEIFDERGGHLVEDGDGSGFSGGGVGAVDGRPGGAVDRRHVDEEVVPRAGRVQLVDDVGVDGEYRVDDGAEVGAIGVADVVDANPEREEGASGVPGHARGVAGVAVDGQEFLLDLLAEREDGWEVGGDEGGVDCCAAVGEVVGFD